MKTLSSCEHFHRLIQLRPNDNIRSPQAQNFFLPLADHSIRKQKNNRVHVLLITSHPSSPTLRLPVCLSPAHTFVHSVSPLLLSEFFFWRNIDYFRELFLHLLLQVLWFNHDWEGKNRGKQLDHAKSRTRRSCTEEKAMN
jgi:hypothetical protein